MNGECIQFSGTGRSRRAHLTAMLSLPPTAADSPAENSGQTTDSADPNEPLTDEKDDEALDEVLDEKEAELNDVGDNDDLIDDLLG